MQNCGTQTVGARGILPGNGRRRLVVKGRVPEHLPEDLAAENARLRLEKPQAAGRQCVVEGCLSFFA